MADRGAIFHEQAYAQGKMLDHSAWQLPRNITPSDVDVVFDANGRVLFAELSSQCREWGFIKKGQRMLYENLVRGGPHVAALCFHSVGIDRPINSLSDIESFQPMLFDHELLKLDAMEGKYWKGFVEAFIGDPLHLRRRLIASSLKQRR